MDFIGYGADSLQRLIHLVLGKTKCLTIVLDPDSIIGLAHPFHDSKLHLSGQVVEPILGRFNQLQFILNVALIILFLERSNDDITIALIGFFIFGVHELNKIFQVHFRLFCFNKAAVHFDD